MVITTIRQETFLDDDESKVVDERNGNIAHDKSTNLQGWDRFFTRGEHAGLWGIFSLGHINLIPHNTKNINNTSNHEKELNIPWMDEHAVRIRAGLLNVLSWISIANVTFIREPNLAITIISLAMWEFVASTIFGLTPLAPLGSLATALAMVFHNKPLWVPAKPKRFAWTIGFIIVLSCLICWRIGWEFGFKQKHAEMKMMKRDRSRILMMEMMDDSMNDDVDCMVMDMNDLSEYPIAAAMIIAIKVLISCCLILTWLEASCGFCLGCFVYNRCGKLLHHTSSNDDQKQCEVCQEG
jgi:hypothetical protein